MRLMTVTELLKVFHLRFHGSKRVRKKNHHRVLRYLNKYGLVFKGDSNNG